MLVSIDSNGVRGVAGVLRRRANQRSGGNEGISRKYYTMRANRN
jgi:hypothetical protein